jgi:hypothetical protein
VIFSGWVINNTREILVGISVAVISVLILRAMGKGEKGRKKLHEKIEGVETCLTEKFDDMKDEQTELNKSIAVLQAQHSINHPGQLPNSG